MQFWLLGIPERVFAPSPAGALLGSAMLSTCAVGAALVVSWRRGGLRILVIATVMLALLLSFGIGPDALRVPFNPSAALVAFIGFLASAWAILDGDSWWWPALVFFGSVSAQAHLTYLIPVAAVALTALVFLVQRIWNQRGRSDRPADRNRVDRKLIATAGVAIVCWSGPLYDQFFGRGNLWALVGAGTSADSKLGLRWAIARAVEQLRVPPSWLSNVYDTPKISAHGAQSYLVPPSNADVVVAGFVALAFVAGVVFAWRRRDTSRLSLAAVSGAAFLASTYSASRLPRNFVAALSTANRTVWWPTGCFVWLFLAVSAVDGTSLLISKYVGVARSGRRRLFASVGSLAAVLICGGVLMARAPIRNEEDAATIGAVKSFAALPALACSTRSGPIAVSGDFRANVSVVPGLVARLSMRPCTVHTDLADQFGSWRALTGQERRKVLITTIPDKSPGLRLIATYDLRHPPPRYGGYKGTAFMIAGVKKYYLYEQMT